MGLTPVGFLEEYMLQYSGYIHVDVITGGTDGNHISQVSSSRRVGQPCHDMP